MSYTNIKVVKKYAKVLFELSCPSSLDSRHEELVKFLGIFENFRTILLNPVVPLDEKKEILNLSLNELACNDVEFENFLRVLLDNKRLGILGDILESYDELVSQYRSVISFELIVARELEPSDKQEFVDKLMSIVKKEININWVVDSSIIGGVIVKFNDKLLDASIRGGIEKAAAKISSINY